ncbi:class I SAM-dependent methyltransferase [Kytococcus sp. Marseille-QA3725]
MTSSNPKASAWDQIGGLFWTQGRVSARPSRTELDLFTADMMPGQRVCMIGASTRELAEEILRRGARLTVLDFSERMIRDLSAVIDNADLRVVDVTDKIPADLVGEHSWVVSDRLINRFDAAEALKGTGGMSALLAKRGLVRTSVKLGLYPMDEKMLEHADATGTSARFWDADSRTIDFSKAGESLEAGVLPHGSIDLDLLKLWYVGRGKEKRFNEAEVREVLLAAGLADVKVEEFPDAPDTAMFTAQRTD